MMHVGVCGRLRVSACTPYTSHSTSADPQLPPQSFSFPLPLPSFFPHILHTSLLLLLLHLIRSSGPRAVGRRLSPGLRSHPRLRLRHRPGSGEELGPGLVHSGTGLRLHRHHRRPFIHAGGTCVGVGACVCASCLRCEVCLSCHYHHCHHCHHCHFFLRRSATILCHYTSLFRPCFCGWLLSFPLTSSPTLTSVAHVRCHVAEASMK
ncbi:hypothetical protein EDB80DRAFT_333778 [Ilyonectria destructans]|nr:hypothetical protein EDB80DRAFT_333778 [Ilyonectria destructans]